MADAPSIFKREFSEYCTSLKETSFDKEKKVYLCEDESHKYVYDFDEIVKKKYPQKQPSSYDALLLKYSDIDRTGIIKKLKNGREVLHKIFEENNIIESNYKFIYCVVYKNTQYRWRHGIEKNEVQFELSSYKDEYFNEIYTNDIHYFTNEYKKQYKKELMC